MYAGALAKENSGRGTYQIVITEVPWLVQKARLIEKLAELLNDKKLPLVADVAISPPRTSGSSSSRARARSMPSC